MLLFYAPGPHGLKIGRGKRQNPGLRPFVGSANIVTANQLHGKDTTTDSISKDRMLNWNRRRNTRAMTNQSSMTSTATPTAATAISTVQPLWELNANHVYRSDSHSRPSTTSKPMISQAGVGWKERRLGRSSAIPVV
jgi:hypothetical protein